MLGERECEKEEKDPTRRFLKDKRAGEREKRKLIWSEATGIVPHVRHGKGHLSLQPFITHMQCRELGTCLAGEGAAGVPVPVKWVGDVGDAPYWILWGFLQWRYKALIEAVQAGQVQVLALSSPSTLRYRWRPLKSGTRPGSSRNLDPCLCPSFQPVFAEEKKHEFHQSSRKISIDKGKKRDAHQSTSSHQHE